MSPPCSLFERFHCTFCHCICAFILCAHAESDFESIVIRFTFEAGREREQPFEFIASVLAADDSDPESTEGFVLYLEVDEVDSRDSGRINIEESVFLVSIVDG